MLAPDPAAHSAQR